MSPSSELKKRAAMAAAEMLPESGTIGLGTGSTADYFIEQLACLVRDGKKYVGVPTSKRSRALAESLGIPLLDDRGPWSIDFCVDGADEVSDALDLIKGGGACHLQEKIVNAATRVNVIIVDASKLSPLLGTRFVVPVEVVPFGHATTARHLQEFGAVTQRCHSGEPVITDSGNCLYDVKTGPIQEPRALDRAMLQIPGVVETGLFIGRADVVVVASPGEIRQLRSKSPN